MENQTIAAIATALAESGISVIRVSGDCAVTIADRIFRTRGKKHILDHADSHTIHYGFIFDGEEIVDEVMVSVMRAPKSYTMEDTVEINCHGGVWITNRVLEVVLRNGARLAEPGEFTKRAFLNGRIDLSKAEAVMDLIASDNELARKCSVSHLQGAVASAVKSLREKIIYEIAFIESALDDPEHISLDGYGNKLSGILETILFEIGRLLDSFGNGRMLKEGIKTVILGKPNAGKSSLLNTLAKEERAIVTDIAGTTRDIVEESVRIKSVSLRIIDTAGIRKAEDQVEKIGVERAVRSAEDADLILYVVDASIPLDENDTAIVSLVAQKNTIILLNKTDLTAVITEEDVSRMFQNRFPVIRISIRKQTGIDELEDMIERLFFHGKISFTNEVFITNVRQKEALKEAYDSLVLVKESILCALPEDFYSIDLMNAYSALGRIMGEEVGEDLVNEIFSRFCMGK